MNPVLLSLLLALAAQAATPKPAEPEDASLRPITPTPGYFEKYPDGWNGIHEAALRLTQKRQGPCDLLLIGDSITYGWGGSWDDKPFIKPWQDAFGSLKAVNFGVGGDKTQNILWRLANGEAQGIQPKVVLLAIGVNNVWDWKVSESAVAAGVKSCVEAIRAKFPAAKVLVVNVLPNQEKKDHPNRQRTDRIRTEIQKLALDKDPSVKVVNFGDKFLDAEGNLPKANFPDFLHPNDQGYVLYAAELKPHIEGLLK